MKYLKFVLILLVTIPLVMAWLYSFGLVTPVHEGVFALVNIFMLVIGFIIFPTVADL
jgi:hypothetical protein